MRFNVPLDGYLMLGQDRPRDIFLSKSELIPGALPLVQAFPPEFTVATMFAHRRHEAGGSPANRRQSRANNSTTHLN